MGESRSVEVINSSQNDGNGFVNGISTLVSNMFQSIFNFRSNRSANSPNASFWEIIATAVVTSISTATLIKLTQKRKARRQLKEELYNDFLRDRHNELSSNEGIFSSLQMNYSQIIKDDGLKSPGISGFAPSEELIREQLARNYAFLGEEGMNLVRNSFVIVVGVGGVGSHAAHMLARSGVGKIRVIDFDQVSLSSLNRHAVAELEDVGTPKTECIRKHLERLAPHVTVEPINKLFNLEKAQSLLEGSPTFVLDCIDNLDTKIDLIKYCVDNNITVISSMGAGAKSDSSRVQIADISETFEDPLARRTRRGLKLKGVNKGVTVVYSTEKPGEVSLLPLEEEKYQHAKEYSALPDFRVRIIPVLGTLPAIFGCCMASYVVTEIAKFPTEPLPIRTREKTHAKVHRDLINRERNNYKNDEPIQLGIHDVGFILDEIWHGRSALSKTFDKIVLTRWDKSKSISFGNSIAFTLKEANIHDNLDSASLEDHYGKEFIEFVESRFKEEERQNKYRL